jgi:hypothetical protein
MENDTESHYRLCRDAAFRIIDEEHLKTRLNVLEPRCLRTLVSCDLSIFLNLQLQFINNVKVSVSIAFLGHFLQHFAL